LSLIKLGKALLLGRVAVNVRGPHDVMFIAQFGRAITIKGLPT
jgi:hypothetical protein